MSRATLPTTRSTAPTPATALAAWLIALALTLQAIVLPLSDTAAAAAPCEVTQQQSCCDQGACCCGDPDICLCVAERPDTPMTPTRDGDPARPLDHRGDLAIPSRSDAIATPMPFTPRNRAVVSSVARPASAVRTQAILSIWLT